MAIQSSKPIPSGGQNNASDYYGAQATLILTATKAATQCPAAIETARKLSDSFKSGTTPPVAKVRKLVAKIAQAMRANPHYEHSALTEYWHTLSQLEESALDRVIRACVAHLCPARGTPSEPGGPQQTPATS